MASESLELAKAYIQIVPTTTGIKKNLEDELSGAGQSAGVKAGNSISSGISSVAGTIAKAATAALAAATAAVTKFASDSVETGKEFDSAMSQVAATMGTTVDQITELRDFAQEMGETTQFSAVQAAEALNYMALAGYDAETAMSMLPTVLDLAAAGGMDLASASDMVTDASSALGLTLNQTSRMVDEMAKTASKSNTSVSQLGEAILTIGGTADIMSGGTAQLATVLGLLADNGIKGSEAGTHLRNMILKLASPTNDGAAAMEALGLEVFDAQGKMRDMQDIISDMNTAMADLTDEQKIKYISDMFNSRDIAAVNALLNTTTERWNELEDSIESSDTSISSFLSTFAEMGGDVDSVNSKLADLGISAEVFQDAIEGAAKDSTVVVDYLTEMAAEGTSFDDVIQALGGDIDLVDKALKKASGAAKTMANTQLDNLSGDMTLFQSALEGTQIALSDLLTPAIREFVQFGTEGLSGITEALKKGDIDGAIDSFVAAAGNGVDRLLEISPKIIEVAWKLLSTVTGGIAEKLPEILPTMISQAIDFSLQLMTGIIEALPELITSLVDALPTILPQLVDGLVDLFVLLCTNFDKIIMPIIEALPEIITSITQALFERLPDIISAMWQLWNDLQSELLAIINAVWDTAVETFKYLWEEWIEPALDTVGGFFSDIWNDVVEVFSAVSEWFDVNVIQPTVEFFEGMWETVSGFFSALWDDIAAIWITVSEWFDVNVIQPVTGFFEGVWESVSGFFKNLWDDIVYWFDTIIGPWIEIAKRAFLLFNDDVIVPLKQWFADMWESIKGAAETAWNAIVDVWNTVSGWFDENIIKPVGEFFSGMWDAISEAASGAWDGIVEIWEKVSGWFDENIISPVGDFFSEMWDNLTKSAGEAWDGVKKVFEVVSDWFHDVFSEAWQKVKDVFSTGGKIFEGIKEGITDVFKTTVNAIIRGINQVITIPFNTLNDMINTLRGINILGVQPFTWMGTFEIPQIPELALGGLIEAPRLIMAGEDGKEAIVPLEKNTGWVRRVAAELSEEYNNETMREMADGIRELSDKIDRIRVVLDSGELVGGILDKIDRQLGINAGYTERGVAIA